MTFLAVLVYGADTYCPESTVSDGKRHTTKKRTTWCVTRMTVMVNNKNLRWVLEISFPVSINKSMLIYESSAYWCGKDEMDWSDVMGWILKELIHRTVWHVNMWRHDRQGIETGTVSWMMVVYGTRDEDSHKHIPIDQSAERLLRESQLKAV